MAEAPGLIEARDLTKRFGDKVAVDHLSFDVEPGRVTGFLGPNGAGKSTTMRLITGLDRPDGGSATIGGVAYNQLAKPLTRVGALLEARSLHPGRSAVTQPGARAFAAPKHPQQPRVRVGRQQAVAQIHRAASGPVEDLRPQRRCQACGH